MRRRDLVAGLLGAIAVALAMLMSISAHVDAASVAAEARDVEVNAALIREIQFMLSRLGIDPGPIDGIAGQQTLRAVGKFQAQSGLPAGDLVSGGKISAAFLERLRSEASRAILGREKKPGEAPEPQAASPSPVAVAPPQPTAPAPDPFAACTFNPGDFRIGATEYTPDKFLQVGFDGSTARAVVSLTARLDEARQIAGSIGGSALAEVQRQARILAYFGCRLKIEQGSDAKKIEPPYAEGTMTAINHKLRYRSAVRTHAGAVRQRNEDAVLERPEIGLWAVADGAGGHQCGDFASESIITALAKVSPPPSTIPLIDDVRTRLSQVNQELREKAADIGPRAVICSTVLVLLIVEGRSCCLWAGDSRCYLLRAGALRQVSRDHSYVQNLVDRGEIRPEAAADHPLAHVVTNLLGAADRLALEERWNPLASGDILLLCSDGLCRALADREIAAILEDDPVERIADQLMESALSRGAQDNVSVVVVACQA